MTPSTSSPEFAESLDLAFSLKINYVLAGGCRTPSFKALDELRRVLPRRALDRQRPNSIRSAILKRDAKSWNQSNPAC